MPTSTSLPTNNANSQPSMRERFFSLSDTIYNSPNIYDSSNYSSDYIRQPYVWVTPNDSDFNKYLESSTIPSGAEIADTERIGKFLASSKGIEFLAKQTLMQSYNAFNETQIYNPLSILSTIAENGTNGFFNNSTTRFIDQDNNLNISPAGTLSSALPSLNLNQGAGLQRIGTANTALTNFTIKYSNKNITNTSDTYKLGDSFVYSTMVNDLLSYNSIFGYNNANQVLQNPHQPYSNPFATINGTSNISSFSPTIVIYSTSPNGSVTTLNTSTITRNSSDYLSAINNSQNNSLLENVYTAWIGSNISTPTDQTNANNIPNLTNTPIVSTINDQLKTILNNISNGYGNNQLNGTNSNTSATALSGIKTYNQLISAAGTVKGQPTKNGYSNAYTNANDPVGTLVSKGFPDVTLGTGIDSYNQQGVVPGPQLTNNSNASFTNANSDLIPFFFTDLVNNIFIPFRATLTGIENPNSGKWSEVRYIGRADRLFVYEGFDRELSFSFKVYANSPNEMKGMWQRINYLASLVCPSNYTQGPNDAGKFIVPPFVKLTIGDLFTNQPAILQSINISVPEEASWELMPATNNYSYLAGLINVKNATVGQVPMCVEISISAALLEKQKSQVGNLMFSDNTGAGNPWSSAIISQNLSGNTANNIDANDININAFSNPLNTTNSGAVLS